MSGARIAILLLAILLAGSDQSQGASGPKLAVVFSADVDLLTGEATVSLPLSITLPPDHSGSVSVLVTHEVAMDSVFTANYELPLAIAKGDHRLEPSPLRDPELGTIAIVERLSPEAAREYEVTFGGCDARRQTATSTIHPVVRTTKSAQAVITSTSPSQWFEVMLVSRLNPCDRTLLHLEGAVPRFVYPTEDARGVVCQRLSAPVTTAGSLAHTMPTIGDNEYLVDMVELDTGFVTLTQSEHLLRLYEPGRSPQAVLDVSGAHLLSPAILSPDGRRVALVQQGRDGEQLMVWDAETGEYSSLSYGVPDWRQM